MANGLVSTLPDISGIIATATLAPEGLVLSSALVLLLGGVFAANRRMDTLVSALSVFMLFALFLLMMLQPVSSAHNEYFSHMFVSDAFSRYAKILLVAGTALTFLISADWLERGDNQRFEFPVLMLFSLLGAMLMVSANDILSLYVSLELSSLPLYVLASMSKGSLKSTEAGIKYFVLGALASGLLLFGASLVYGFAGTTGFDALAQLLAKTHVQPAGGVVLGMVMMIAGLCFKISGAPFHMWTPDVYEGAPTPVTAFFSVVPKVAAMVLFTRLLIGPFGSLIHEWRQVIVFVSILSMLAGAFGALTQSNIKRLLAYSSIGHVGYALMGLAAGDADGISSILIYFALYIPMSAGAFACVLFMNIGGQAVENINDLAGLSRSRPHMAFALSVFMFSMAGIPPLAGFFGKLYVFLAALHAGLVALAVIGVLSSVVACYYYIKLVKLMYFDEPAQPFDQITASGSKITMAVCAVITTLFFLAPGPLVEQAKIAALALWYTP